MPLWSVKTRFMRVLPGRIRIEVYGLQNNRSRSESIKSKFAGIRGVWKVDPCPVSGRLLLVFDERLLSLEQILHEIGLIEDGAKEITSSEAYPTIDISNETEPEQGYLEAAVTIETNPLEHSCYEPSVGPSDKIPLPLALTMGGLAVLGVKQMLMGRSELARSPAPFYLSGLISVVTGYPFLKRGVQAWGKGNKWNSDLILGTSSLALALIRENLVVLAGLSILQYVNWKRNQAVLHGNQEIVLNQEIERYSEQASKFGMIAAAATLALTRNPLRSLAVLLAANPRTATLPAEAAWKQAEIVSRERNYATPSNATLSHLVRTKRLVIEDSSYLFKKEVFGLECITNENDHDKVICLAASLMLKSRHPWNDEVWDKAKQTCRTIRTAFQVEEDEEGIKGKINDSWVYAGTLSYLQKHGLDCSIHALEAKRYERKGVTVLFVAKKDYKTSTCIGLLIKKQAISTEYEDIFTDLKVKGWKISLMNDTLGLNSQTLHRYGIDLDSVSIEVGEWIEELTAMKQVGEEILYVSCSQQTSFDEIMKKVHIPTIELSQLKDFPETLQYAEQMNGTIQSHYSISKRWNLYGSVLAAFGIVGAPLINLATDAISLVFLSRTGKASKAPVYTEDEAFMRQSSYQEIASASEAVSWYNKPWKSTLDHFHLDPLYGLTNESVTALRNEYGTNQLEGRKSIPWLVSYLGQFKEFSTFILLGTTLLSFITGGIFDGVAMGTILLANAAIGTMQERKAERAVDALNQFQPPTCTVLRNGEHLEISAEQLVPGDIVCLEAGDRVPADIRIMESMNLQVNEAALTGESLPIAKMEVELSESLSLSERTNMLFMGTDVCRGKGRGIVVQTGMNTEIGHVMSLLKSEDKEITPLQEKVTSISKKFVKGALIAGGLVFITGLIRGVPLAQMISTSITLAASAIPEGLPVTITIALSAGIFRMAKKNALIRKLSALETLGRTTVICSDKTGTLTKNEMTVKAIATVDQLWTVTGNGYEPIGEIQKVSGEVAASTLLDAGDKMYRANQTELDRLLHISLLCNNSKLEQLEQQWRIKGDPTEGALLTLAAKKGLWQHDLKQWHRGHEIPFDSNSGKMSVVCHDTTTVKECYVFSKGAIETILRHCSKYQSNGQVFELTDERKSSILEQHESLSSDALRVLGFAYRPIPRDEEEVGIDEKDMIYVGMVGMMDPPKSEVETSIREAQILGVKSVMITGDHPITAIAIAKQLGIYDGTSKVLSGAELDCLSDEELSGIVEEVSIFARVTPEHKLRIVTAFQRHGHIVAMTGDGVNDTPAIKQANVGIAMGRNGTEVTKETADMVLTEDDFGSIVEGVKEGRTIISNIRKALGCLLTGNLAEILVTSVAVMFGLPIPLVPIQILLMNLLTDALPAMILAVNPGNKTKVTKRMDIADKELYQKVITRGVLLGIGSLGLFAAALAAGTPIAVAQTVAFATLVTGQLIQTFSWRQEGSDETVRDWSKDRFLLGAFGVSLLALLTAIYVPPVSRFFHTTPLGWKQWLPILAVAGSVSLLSKPVLSLITKKQSFTGQYKTTFAAAR
jgi:Ca2+-transporting ATPase